MSAELGTTLDVALAQLDRAATEASVHEDPLELPFTALAAFLRAQRQLYAEADAALAQHLETAKQPVRDDELRRAVTSGIRAHAAMAVRAINWQSALYLALGGLVMAVLGFAGGAWWQHGISSAELTAAQNVVVAAHDGFPAGLRAQDLALWQELIRMNPNVSEALRSCESLPQAKGGSACALPVWTLRPPPLLATPATH
jgi:hypothetical protein